MGTCFPAITTGVSEVMHIFS